MAEIEVVPEYDIWSNYMKVYLLSLDLWDVIEIETDESSEKHGSKSWRRKNASALHAIHVSCGSAAMSKIGKLESAKEAWDLLRSINISAQHSHHDSGDTNDHRDGEANATQPLHDSSHSEQVVETITDEQSSDDIATVTNTMELQEIITDEQSTEAPKDVIIDYGPFVEATRQGNWKAMEEFLDSHPGANTKTVVDGQTALHYVLNLGNIWIGRLLVDKTNVEDLEIQDNDGYTAFARLANHNHRGVLELLNRMVLRNPRLPSIGNSYTIPIVVASSKGFEDTTSYLFSVNYKNILDPAYKNIPIPKYQRIVGVDLIINCMNMGLFDIARIIVGSFPEVLQQENREGISPIYALAKSFSGLKIGSRLEKSMFTSWLPHSWKYVEQYALVDKDKFQVFKEYDARLLLRSVCEQVKSFDASKLEKYVYAAMIEASKDGLVEFVREMLIAQRGLIIAHVESKGMFWHAIENRQEKVYNLIYDFMREKDSIFSDIMDPRKKNNILHLVAELAPSAVLNRASGPVLQMQRELQWFKEVWSLAEPRYRVDLNNNNLTPRALFTKAHAELIDEGEEAMKDTAQSCTVVGALIVTMMFAAAFTVPGGNNQDTGLPIFLRTTLFRIFIVSDALSLYSSTTSVLVFLGILTSRYSEEDFFIRLPRKLMVGLSALFFGMTTMMISFFMALILMLDGQLRYVLPTVLLGSVPIIIFMSSIVLVLEEMFKSTFGSSIFDESSGADIRKYWNQLVIT